jgi:outer membrane PBP1 activator LpoA protein
MHLMRPIRAAGFCLLTALALSACVPGNVQRTPEEIAAAQGADALAQRGQFEQAAQAYLALAAQSPGRADQYRLLAAEAWRQDGRIEQAAPTIAAINRRRLRGDEPFRLDLLQAELALQRNDAPTALQITLHPSMGAPDAYLMRLLELRARAMAATGDRWGSARTRVEMDTHLSGLDQSQNRQQILSLLSQLGVEPLQRRAAAMRPGDRMLPWINEALSQLGVAVARPQPTLQQPVGTLLPGADANVREGYKVPAHLALLLPANGDYAAASSAIRQGFFAAYLDAARNHAPRPSVRVYDSLGSPDGAVKAYRQAVSDGAQLVVGPLTRTEVAAVFAQSPLPVPLLALNHPDDKQLPAGDVSEFGLLPETEGAQAADHMVERGIRHAYVLTSGDDFAQRAASAFQAELESHGGDVSGRAALPSSSVTYTDAIGSLGIPGTGTPVSSVAEPATASSTLAASPAPVVPSDTGIFISMRPAQARLLVPQLKIANITLPIFATSHVYAGVDDTSANGDLDGVEFCDAPWLFDAQSGLPRHDDVANLLPTARGGAARLFAFGMDAWNLVPYLDWLRQHPGSYLPGASGQLTADQFGRVRRVLIWAKFQGGLARPLGGSLQMDDVPVTLPPGGDTPAPAASTPAPASQPVGY